MRFDDPNTSNSLDYIRMVRGVAPGASYGARIANTTMSPSGELHIGVRTLYNVWPNSGFDIVDESDNVLGATTATNISIDSGMFKVTDTGSVALSVSIKGDGTSGDTLLQRLAVDNAGHASKLIYSTSPALVESEINKEVPGDSAGRWIVIP
jgi:hypothetical protein